MATFSTKSLHFPGGVPKKPKILDSSGLAFAKTLKSLFFLVFLVLLRKWQRFPPKACIFLEGYQKPKKNKDFGLFRPRLRQDSKIFGFCGFFVPPQEMATFSTKSLHFPGGVPKKPKKTKILDSSGLAFAKTLKSLVFLVFLVPPQEMATFSTKSLHFPGGVPKKPKKTKILDSSSLAFAKTLKSLFFLVFLVPPQEMATFSTKSLHFPGGVPKKTKKLQGLAFAKTLKSLVFWFFGTSSGNGNVFHQKLAFSWRGTKMCAPGQTSITASKASAPGHLVGEGLYFGSYPPLPPFRIRLHPQRSVATVLV